MKPSYLPRRASMDKSFGIPNKAFFGYSHIHLNPHVLMWIGVYLKLYTSIHLSTCGLRWIQEYPKVYRLVRICWFGHENKYQLECSWILCVKGNYNPISHAPTMTINDNRLSSTSRENRVLLIPFLNFTLVLPSFVVISLLGNFYISRTPIARLELGCKIVCLLDNVARNQEHVGQCMVGWYLVSSCHKNLFLFIMLAVDLSSLEYSSPLFSFSVRLAILDRYN